MARFEVMQGDQARVKLGHVGEGQAYEFGFVKAKGAEWQDRHLVSQTEGDGSTGTGLAVEYLEQAGTSAASAHTDAKA